MAAVAAAQPRETVRQDAALEEGVERILDELGQPGPGAGLGVRKAFLGARFIYTLRLASGERVLAQVPSHHDHAIGEWIGIRPEVDHLVTFAREAA